jgi:uncharacterized protein YjbI with pentapeptide repeats
MEELPNPSEFRLDTDIQAVLTVLGRRTHTYNRGEKQRLNLMNADLWTTDLRGAQLQGADLYKAQLQGAYLQDAWLKDTYLRRAQLQGAHLLDAQLQGADLKDAQLQGVQNLTVEQLLTVKTLYEAKLDQPLREEIKQRRPSLLDKPRHNLDDLCAE